MQFKAKSKPNRSMEKIKSNYEINRGKIRLSKPFSLMQQLFLQNTRVVPSKEISSQQNDRVRSFLKSQQIKMKERLQKKWKQTL